MSILFLVNVIFSIVIVSLLIAGFLKLYKNKSFTKIVSYLLIIGVFYSLLAFSSFLWLFEFLKFSNTDFIILYSIIIFMQSLLLLKVISLISNNKKLFYFLFFYPLILISIFYSWSLFFNILIIVSFLLCFVFFMDFAFRSKFYRRISYLGMAYSLLGVIFQFLFVLGIGNLVFYNIFIEIVFFVLIYLFFKDIALNPPAKYTKFKFKEKSYFSNLIEHLVFIIVITNLVFIGTLGVHEIGHFSVAKIYGCQAEKIVYEEGYLHTEVLCKDNSNNLFVLLGGILLPFFIAIILFFVGGRFMRDMSFLIIGFNLLASSRDFSDLHLSDNLIIIPLFFGVLFLITGIIILAKSKVEDDIYLS
ncbi:hypothetical protein K9L16_01390 [Candidatus Pacearchaeota archaeon]|nr:hypothetical protein [Candidatus Pacearchaeota archaeon]